MADLRSGKVKLPVVQQKLARNFHSVYASLLDLMAIQDGKGSGSQQPVSSSAPPSSAGTITTTSAASVKSLKRPPPSSLAAGSAKKAKTTASSLSGSEPTTPDQLTHPVNPNYSGDTAASQDEDITKELLIRVIYDSLSILAPECSEISWQLSGNFVELHQTYLLSWIKLI